MAELLTDVNRNPDGQRFPVFFDMPTRHKNGSTSARRVQILSSDDERLDYVAVDPDTQDEVALKTTDWELVYAQLNKQPPPDLARRLRLYRLIRKKKSELKTAHQLPTSNNTEAA